MFEKELNLAEKMHFSATETIYQFGSYYDGTEHNFSFPCLLLTFDSNINGHELINVIDEMDNFKKKAKMQVYSKGYNFGQWYFILLTEKDIEEGKKGYSECIAFQEGFWLKKHSNKNATQEELIKAGHDSLMKHGYKIRIA